MNATLVKVWQSWGKSLVIALVVMTGFRSAVADWNDVPTGSMKPTILEGDRILVDKLAYDLRVPWFGWSVMRLREPARGEIVVLFSPQDGVRLVKRVVGVPGDTIELDHNRLIVNGEQVEYGALDPEIIAQLAPDQQSQHEFASENLTGRLHAVMTTPARPTIMRSFGPVQVPDGQFLVMGDNRDESNDSRFFGFVPRASIVGRASTVMLSLDPNHSYLPRWHRFWRSLL
jgi:signal peptidase I